MTQSQQHEPINTAPASQEPIPRAELVAWYDDDIRIAGSRFLAELHDITFHYGDGSSDPSILDEPIDHVAATLAHVIDRVRTAADTTAQAIATAIGCRAWASGGAPMRCQLCGLDIDPTQENWRVCDGWAEHPACHQDDAIAEAQDRAWTIDEDEYQAHLANRAYTGPQPGDRVRLTHDDSSTLEGTWALGPDGQPVLRHDDGTTHHHVTGHVRCDVIDLADDEEQDASPDGTGAGGQP
jgi:hypothetical protein